MIEQGTGKHNDIVEAAKKLFMEKGYTSTTVRDIVETANTSMGNLYFHFPNKISILKHITKKFITVLRNQIKSIHELDFPPEVGFALDFKIGYITTLEDVKLSQYWVVVQNTPEIHKYSLENKKIRLQTFFGERIDPDELDYLATAIQGIADGIFQQKREGKVNDSPGKLSNTIIDYSLRILGFNKNEIQNAIAQAEKYINEHEISTYDYFNF